MSKYRNIIYNKNFIVFYFVKMQYNTAISGINMSLFLNQLII